ncbi:MAG TPA: dihydrofolate reductase family protein [Planctomycetota bacterium]|jgi:dihydrofolate reductase|nr:dihydrofolate reductase family protein [Planctomycetota bacterium]
MRKVVYYVATSADGFIARPDGDVAWLDRPQPSGGYGMVAFYRSVDTVLLGRKTHEVGRRMGQESYAGKRNVVFSRRSRKGSPGVEFVREDPGAFVRTLRGAAGKDIWLVGGGALAGALLDAAQVDEIVVHVVPILIGEGIPLFAPRRRSASLRLVSSRPFPDGVVRKRYSVSR